MYVKNAGLHNVPFGLKKIRTIQRASNRPLLLRGWNTEHMLNSGLDIADGVAVLHIKHDDLAVGHHQDLCHTDKDRYFIEPLGLGLLIPI